MSPAKQLYELQDVDQELERKNAARAAVERLLADESELQAARQELEATKLNHYRCDRELRQAESELDGLHGKITAEEQKLYGGQVKNFKELENLRLEVNSLKDKHRFQEGQVLTWMELAEAAKQEAARLDLRLNQLSEQRQSQVKQWTAQRDELRRDISSLQEKRDGLASRIDPLSLGLYSNLRRSRQPVVVLVEQGRCHGCRLSLSLNEIQKARLALIQCSSCGRILYSS